MQIILGIVIIVILLLIIAAVLPKTAKIHVETVINAPKSQVRDYVSKIKNQENYSVWVMADPSAKPTYTGVDGTVWFIAAWDSQVKNVGKGAQEITSIQEGTSYDVELRFERPMKAINYAQTTLEDLWNNQTKVINTFQGDTPRPFNLMSLLFMPKLRKDMQTNLDNLKVILEK